MKKEKEKENRGIRRAIDLVVNFENRSSSIGSSNSSSSSNGFYVNYSY